MMIRVLPKTFQDGAMKVLHEYMKTNGEANNVRKLCVLVLMAFI